MIAAVRTALAGEPLTREDLARWWGVGPAVGGRMLETLGDEAVEVHVEGGPMWMLAAEAARAPKAKTVRLLPGLDRYVLAATPPRREADPR